MHVYFGSPVLGTVYFRDHEKQSSFDKAKTRLYDKVGQILKYMKQRNK